jgi:FKBP-type peptidyl-prolyl cis-trans isomerase
MAIKKMMKPLGISSFLTLLMLLAPLLQASEKVVPSTSTLKENMGYFYGFSFGNMLKDGGSADVDLESVLRGLKDSLSEKLPALTDAQREQVYQEVESRYLASQIEKKAALEQQAKKANEEGRINLVSAEEFLAKNAARDGVFTTKSGLQYEILIGSEGTRPLASDRVVVNYVGKFENGDIFDQSGASPTEFGLEQVISGWTEGLQLMAVGNKFKFFLHPDLAYGAGTVGSIPSNSLLVFEIELLEIK